MLVEKRDSDLQGVVEAAERLLAGTAASRRGVPRVAERAPRPSCALRFLPDERESDEPLIRVNGLTLRLGSFTSLEDVSFTVAKGQVVALCGPRGCGSSAMLDVMGCTLPGAKSVDMRGSIELEGHDAYRTLGVECAREKVARVFFGGAFEMQNVRNAIAFPIRQRGIHDEAAIAAEIDRVLRLIDAERHLGESLDCAVSTLPALDRRLVSIARALAKRPLALLVSEPATTLDRADSLVMSQALESIARKAGCAVVVATSDPEFVHATADEAVVFLQGRVVEEGPISALDSVAADYRARAFFERRIA